MQRGHRRVVEASSRLGIYDQLSSPDYERRQEFGICMHARHNADRRCVKVQWIYLDARAAQFGLARATAINLAMARFLDVESEKGAPPEKKPPA